MEVWFIAALLALWVFGVAYTVRREIQASKQTRVRSILRRELLPWAALLALLGGMLLVTALVLQLLRQ